jgi:FKBP-type peptidyl-prolyl cis-trans isomerase
MPHSDPEVRKEYNRLYRLKNLERLRQKDREYRENNAEKIYERNRKYVAKNIEKHRAWTRKASKKWRKKHGAEYYKKYAKKPGENVKVTAHSILHKAIKDGKVDRPATCADCGIKCTPHGHHPDYTKPLEVIWLCGLCHKKAHALLKATRRSAPLLAER